MNLSQFFINCSGANKEILEQCPTEKTKFVGIGSTIFFTAMLAAISGGYAIFFTFNSLPISILFGIIWGLMIFSLDRYIVTSINKPNLPTKADMKRFSDDQPATIKKKILLRMERKRLVLKQFWSAAPRILIALVLAITISKPLEIKLFDGTITKQLGQMESNYNKGCEDDFNNQRMGLEKQKQQFKNELDKSRNTVYLKDPIYLDILGQKDAVNKTIVGLKGQININQGIIRKNTIREKKLIDKEKNLYREYTRITDIGRGKIAENQRINGQISANNIKLYEMQKQVEERKKELIDNVRTIETGYSKQIASVQAQINDLNSRRDLIINKCRQESAADKDILSRLRALGELKKNGGVVMYASLLITLLFMLLETSPITVKLLSNRGAYDDLIEAEEIRIKMEQSLKISKALNDIEYTKSSHKAKLENKLKSEEDILKSSYDMKQEISSLLLQRWKEQQVGELLEVYNQRENEIDQKKLILDKQREELNDLKKDIEDIKDSVIIISDDEIRQRAEIIWKYRNQGSDELNWKKAIQELKDKFKR